MRNNILIIQLSCYRMCPGRHMVWSELWIMIASMLATMKIGKAVDENGIEIELVEEWRSAGNLSVPRSSTMSSLTGFLGL